MSTKACNPYMYMYVFPEVHSIIILMERQKPSSLSEQAEPVLKETGGKDIIGSKADIN